MTKLEEVIAKYNYDNDSFLSIESMMRDYAEIYAKKCLEIAAEQAIIRMEFTLSFGEPSVYYVKETEQNNYNLSIHKESIITIELPDHD